MRRRVVITGLGSVSALGVGAGALWAGLLEGTPRLKRIGRFDPAGFPCRLAGEVPDYAVKDFVPKSYRKATKVMARDIELAVGAAKTAADDAGLVTRWQAEETPGTPMTYPGARMGCQIGAGLIAAEEHEMTQALATARENSETGGVNAAGAFSLRKWGGEGGGGMENLTPLWLLKYLPNMLACHVTIVHGLEGPSNTITCAEASGTLSICESTRVIRRGAADLCFSGGAECKITLMGLLRLHLAGRVAPTGDETDATRILRPFDPGSVGGVLGEGGGICILEERDGALARGARAYAEIVGVGSSHSNPDYSPGQVDEGLVFAIQNALENAGVPASKLDAVVPMGLGVPSMDAAEAGALRAVLGDRVADVPLVTITPAVGNCVAGLGGLQVVVAAKALAEQRLPARVRGGGSGTPAVGMRCASGAATGAKLEYVLVLTGSLGGQNGAVVLKRV